MKRTPLKRKSKSNTKKLQDQVWERCKKIIKILYGDTCYTCGRANLTGSNRHTGHMWPKASLSAHLKYDVRILRPQCYHCNINLGGNGAVFYARMVRDMGQEYMDNLTQEKQIIIKADEIFYQNLIDKYDKEIETYSRLNKG